MVEPVKLFWKQPRKDGIYSLQTTLKPASADDVFSVSNKVWTSTDGNELED